MPAKLTTIRYAVTVIYDGKEIGTTESADFPLGHVSAPWSCSFDTQADFDDYFTVIDANGDFVTWEWNETYQRALIKPSEQVMDDWLLLPPVAMEQGKAYRITFNAAKAGSDDNESIAAFIGTSPSVDAMTTPLVKTTTIDVQRKDGGIDFEVYYVCPATGDYTIGLYGCSPADSWYLYVDDVAVGAPLAGTNPGEPTAFSATSPEDGSLSATIVFDAPALDLAGNALSQLTGIKVLRDDTEVTVLTPAVGESGCEWTDTEVSNGLHKYTLIPYGPAGEGKRVHAEVFVGFDLPMPVLNVTNRMGASGEASVHIEWPAVTEDVRGRTLAADKVTYILERMWRNPDQPETIMEGGQTSYDDVVPVQGDDQFWMQYRVTAVSAGGSSTPTQASDLVPVGPAYTLPFAESFADGDLKYNWTMRLLNGTHYWQLAGDNTLTNAMSQDGDNGYLVFVGSKPGESCELASGKFAVDAKTPNPTLTFQSLTLHADDRNTLKVYAIVQGVDNPVELQSMTTGGETGWHKVSVDLAPYAGKQMQLAFQATVVNYDAVAIDNIRVNGVHDIDLELTSIQVPDFAWAGQNVQGSVRLTNRGAKPVNGAKVDICAMGQTLLTLPVPQIVSDQTLDIPFEHSTDVLAPETVVYTAVVIAAGDADPSNDQAESATVNLLTSPLPAPGTLSAVQREDKVMLEWEAPDMTATPRVSETEGFETLAHLSTDLKGWTTVDADGMPCGGLQGMPLEGVNGTPRGFIPVKADTQDFISAGFTPHTGSMAMMSMYAYDQAGNRLLTDDWLISPELSGDAQRVSLFARSYHSSYPEDFEIAYSTSDADPASFTTALSVKGASTAWTRYEIAVPAGTRYVAIHNQSLDKYILLVDDVTLALAGAPAQEIALNGYNLYRNGERLASVEPGTTRYIDPLQTGTGTHRYFLTAQYDKGEGAPGEEVTVNYSGIATAGADAIRISTSQGCISVSGAAGLPLDVYTLEGFRIFTTTAAPQTAVIPCTTGLYIVRAGGNTKKVEVN